MSVILPIQQYIALGRISSYLAGRDIANQEALKGGSIYMGLRDLLLTVTESVEWAFTLNPNDPTLNATGLYLYALCGRYISQAINILNNQAAGIATLSGPSDQSVNVGQSATFTITVTSSSPYTISWYRNGALIPGASGLSYTLNNAQLSDTLAQFSAIVTNAGGPAYSAVGVLTVSAAALSGRFYWGDTDYSSDINAGNNDVAYNGTFSVTAGQPLSVQFPSGAANFKYIVVEYPATESTKTQYASPPIDTGIIPNIAFDNIKTIGSVKLIFSRSGNPFSQNTANPVIFS